MASEQETLSSNSLFHFTRSATSLINILKKGFFPKYCLENYSMFDLGFKTEDVEKFDEPADKFKELAVPMVCFCDLPLSKIKHHTSLYGSYGIGLTKDWGNKNGVSPVLYFDSKSETIKGIQDAIFYLNELNSPEQTQIPGDSIITAAPFIAPLLKITRFLRFVKPYSGKFWRQGSYIDNVRFYDEREWRYVPDIRPAEDKLPLWIDKEIYTNEVSKADLDSKLEQSDRFHLRFDPDDVKYIIVEKEDHIIAIIETLESMDSIYSMNTIKKLTSRVITQRQIQDDF